MDSKSRDTYPYKRHIGEIWHRKEESNVITEAEIWAQARGCSSHQKLEEQGRILPSSPQREHSPADTFTLDFWPPELWEQISVVLIYSFGNYPQETNTARQEKDTRGGREHSAFGTLRASRAGSKGTHEWDTKTEVGQPSRSLYSQKAAGSEYTWNAKITVSGSEWLKKNHDPEQWEGKLEWEKEWSECSIFLP